MSARANPRASGPTLTPAGSLAARPAGWQRGEARATAHDPLEPIAPIVARVMARLCERCDDAAAPDDTHCAPCRAEIEMAYEHEVVT